MIRLVKHIDSIIFCLTTNLLCIFDICWVPLQFYLLRMMFITLHNSKILLSLHCFLTPQFQTFTNLLIGIFGLVIPLIFLFEIGINYVSVIVTIISNTTMLQCYLVWIFVSIRRLLQLMKCIGVSTPSQKHQPLLFCQAPS